LFNNLVRALNKVNFSLFFHHYKQVKTKNIMKKIVLLLTVTMSLVFANTVTAQKTIVDVAVGNEDFSTLVTALTAADLVSALQADGPFTVFAPTNAAFAKIDEATLSSLLEEKNKKALADILTYHVVSGKLAAEDVVAALEAGEGSVELKTLNGQVITVMQKDDKILLKDANGNFSEIVATDVMGSNGVIHVINAVAMPK
jgi:uncharacterized surface protein with fasciclin (FAS1) repeats